MPLFQLLNMKIIFGLGNPGKTYEKNYHNLGFMVIDKTAERLGVSFNKKGRQGVYAETALNGEKVILVKPQTYMNNSGECVQAFMTFYKVAPKDVLVIYDDIDIDKGSLRFRPHGSPGTHNGMRSITAHIGQDFKRLRVGAKKTNPDIPLIDYVLMNLTAQDAEILAPAIVRAGDCAFDFAKGYSDDQLMAIYNKTV